MDGSSTAPSNPPHPAPSSTQQQQQQQQAGLVRVDQVDKLPHLTDVQKSTHKQAVRTLWEALGSNPPNSNEYMNAHSKLSQLSQTLLKDVRLYQQRRAQQQHIQNQQQQMQQQQQQQQGPQQGQQPAQQSSHQNQKLGQQPAQQPAQQQAQRQGQQQGQQADSQQQQSQVSKQGQQAGANQANQTNQPAQARNAMTLPQTFQQLLPQIQAKVNSLNFVLPPRITEGSTEHWLEQAKLRYGLALQKQELGKVKLNELKQSYNQRTSAGNLSPEEIQDFRTRQASADKLFREGSGFLSDFKQQQEQFRKEHQEAQQAASNAPEGQRQGGQASGDASQPQTATTERPAPHTISSAVDAARHQAEQAHAQQAQSQATATQQAAQQSQQPQQPQAPPQQTQQQPQQPQQQPQEQQPFTQTAQQRGYGQQSPDSSAQMSSSQGAPRSLSQQAMSQAAQSQQSMAAQAAQAANSHAHPAGLSRAETGSRNVTMQIPKTLNVPAPEAVSMGAARPTLTAGASYGSTGPMAQPAIQRHPGYVLEGDGQRVLSKKMLDTLVRQVTGGGENNGLTPDAEEFVLQMADDFVDEVITAACRLAKLRPSSSLDIRDIQLVLERNYNIRIPGFSSDDLRTVKKPHPTPGWTQKMSAVQAAKVTQARID